MAGTKREYELEREVKHLCREVVYLKAKIEALQSGGGEFDNTMAAPNSAPYDGKKVFLWDEPWGWLPDAVYFDQSAGLFMQDFGGRKGCNSGHQHCKLWKPDLTQ